MLISTVKMSNIEDKLLNYQIPHLYQLEEILKLRQCALDGSDTGTGKTYIALALAKKLNLQPFIICPKSVISNWINVAKEFDIEIFGISNYEMLKGCNYYTSNLERTICPYLDKIDGNFQFYLPKTVLVIFDEAHRCKNYRSITSKLLLSIKHCACKILLLSATITDKIDCFKPFGTIFGFYNDPKEYTIWMRRQKTINADIHKRLNLDSTECELDIIHRSVFPKYGSRLRIAELGDMFPKNQVSYQEYFSTNEEEIQHQYEIIKEAYEELKNKETRAIALGRLIRARQKIEMLKLPIMLDIIEEALESKYSVAVFVNYCDTLEYLTHYFETDCVIRGGQSIEDRQGFINRFQNNESKIIICMIQAGGVGVSLHDIHGGHPRMSIISPTWSGQDMVQCLGRIHRAGSQSAALQRIVFVAKTYESEICELIKKKMTNLSAINDHDLIGPNIPIEQFEEIQNIISDSNDNINDDNNNIDDDNEQVKKYEKIIKKQDKKKFIKKQDKKKFIKKNK